jgi:hypothetical protein
MPARPPARLHGSCLPSVFLRGDRTGHSRSPGVRCKPDAKIFSSKSSCIRQSTNISAVAYICKIIYRRFAYLLKYIRQTAIFAEKSTVEQPRDWASPRAYGMRPVCCHHMPFADRSDSNECRTQFPIPTTRSLTASSSIAGSDDERWSWLSDFRHHSRRPSRRGSGDPCAGRCGISSQRS